MPWPCRPLAPASCRSACQKHRNQAQSDLVVQHDPDHPQRRPSQRIGILAPGRLFVDRPEPDQRVDLVGERDSDRDRIGRHQVVRSLRLVVVLAGCGDGCVLALRLGVVAAHQALQFGEFADHLGQQVGLGELRRAPGLVDIGADQRRQFGRQSFDALNALAPACPASRGTRCWSNFGQPIFEPRL